MLAGTRSELQKRKKQKDNARQEHSAAMVRGSLGALVEPNDPVIVKEEDSLLRREGTPATLAHEHWTNPWQLTGAIQSGLSFESA